MAKGVDTTGSGMPKKPAALSCAWELLVVSLIGLAGSLYLSIGMGLKACALCFYQRTFIMGLFALVTVGLVVDRARAALLCLVSLPLAVGGLGVAAFHEYLVVTHKLECPAGILGLGTAPAQSLSIFALLTAVAILGARTGTSEFRVSAPVAVVGAIVLGLLLAWGAVASAPPMPAGPTKAYDPEKQPLDTCRPPFRSP
jgi:disulfide bond formation protein DsbB